MWVALAVVICVHAAPFQTQVPRALSQTRLGPHGRIWSGLALVISDHPVVKL